MRCAGFIALAASVIAVSSVAEADEQNVSSFAWTGFYAGLQAGWSRTSADTSLTPIPSPDLHPDADVVFRAFGTGSADEDNFAVGGQVGYNQQIGGIVVGIEADMSGLSSQIERHVSGIVDVDNGAPDLVTLNDTIDADYVATIRGRLGWAVGRTLIYGTGGIALTHVSFDREIFLNQDGCPVGTTACHAGSASEFMTGWTAGGGVEHALLNNLTLKVEYLYAEFDDEVSFVTRNSAAPPNVNQLLEHSAKLDSIQTIRLGVNAKF
jgi:outer membrane immunogenic protein